MKFNTIALEFRDAVASIRLARESQMNSLSLEMIDELKLALKFTAEREDVRVAVLTGTGPAFCAGADLKEVLSIIESEGVTERDFLDNASQLFAALRDFAKPLVAGLNGITMAGGLELAMCCDIIVASNQARIADAHSNFGVFPGGGGAAVLPNRIGLANAKYLLFTGHSLSAARLCEMGLIQEVVAHDKFDARLKELAGELADKSPLVLRRMKQVANASIEMSQAGALKLELETLRNHLRSDDAQEGLTAFREKRSPVFKGR